MIVVIKSDLSIHVKFDVVKAGKVDDEQVSLCLIIWFQGFKVLKMKKMIKRNRVDPGDSMEYLWIEDKK